MLEESKSYSISNFAVSANNCMKGMDHYVKQLWQNLFNKCKISFKISQMASDGNSQVFNLISYGKIRVFVKKGCAIGSNFLSDAYSLEIKLQNGKSYHSFVKVLPACPLRRKLGYISEVSHREVQVYQYLIPSLQEFQKQHNLINDVLITVPEAFYVNLEFQSQEKSSGNSCTVVLEDLKRRGFKTVNMKVGCDYEHASLALQTLAKFHATTFAFIKSNNHRFPPKLEFLNETMVLTEKRTLEIIRNCCPLHLNILRNNQFNEEANWMEQTLFPYLDKLAKAFESSEDCDSLTSIIHGDSWINNIMFQYQEDEVQSAILVDLQLVRPGHPGTDILYFLFSSTTPQIRQKHFNKLLRNYYSNFYQTLTLYGIHLEEEGYHFEKFQSEVEKRYLWALLMALMLLPTILEIKSMDEFKYAENKVDNQQLTAEEILNGNDKLYTPELLLCQRIAALIREVQKVVGNQ